MHTFTYSRTHVHIPTPIHAHTHTHPCVYRQNRQAVQINTQAGWQAYAYTDSDTDTCTVCQCTDRQTHRLAGRQSRKTDVCIH